MLHLSIYIILMCQQMQQLLKERQDQLRMKSAARTVETAVALQSSGNVNGGSAEATATVGVN